MGFVYSVKTPSLEAPESHLPVGAKGTFCIVFYLFFFFFFLAIPHPTAGEGDGNPLFSSTLAWKIPWAEEPGRLQSMGSLRVGHHFTFTFHFMHWRRKWQPTPVFLPGESQGRGSLVGCRLWGCTESDTTEAT